MDDKTNLGSNGRSSLVRCKRLLHCTICLNHVDPRFIKKPRATVSLRMKVIKVKVDSYIALLRRWPDQRALQSRKWQLVGKSQWCCSANCGHPIARVNVQLDPRYAASKHTTAPINHTRPLPRKHSPDVAARARKQTSDYCLLLNLSTSKARKAELA